MLQPFGGFKTGLQPPKKQVHIDKFKKTLATFREFIRNLQKTLVFIGFRPVYGSIINKKRDIPRYWTHIEPGWWYTCPSEEYEFVSRDDYIFPYIMESHKTHVPNHQPVYYYIAIVYTSVNLIWLVGLPIKDGENP